MSESPDQLYESTERSLNNVYTETTKKQGFLCNTFKTSTNKIPLTIIYCMVFWNFGICVALFGPTLLDLACQTGSTLTAITWLYFVQNFTSLIGCIVSGLLIKHSKCVEFTYIITYALVKLFF